MKMFCCHWSIAKRKEVRHEGQTEIMLGRRAELPAEEAEAEHAMQKKGSTEYLSIDKKYRLN